MGEPRYFLDRADKIVPGKISANCIHYDWRLQQFVFKNVPFTASEHFDRAAFLISSLESDIASGKLTYGG